MWYSHNGLHCWNAKTLATSWAGNWIQATYTHVFRNLLKHGCLFRKIYQQASLLTKECSSTLTYVFFQAVSTTDVSSHDVFRKSFLEVRGCVLNRSAQTDCCLLLWEKKDYTHKRMLGLNGEMSPDSPRHLSLCIPAFVKHGARGSQEKNPPHPLPFKDHHHRYANTSALYSAFVLCIFKECIILRV